MVMIMTVRTRDRYRLHYETMPYEHHCVTKKKKGRGSSRGRRKEE